MKAWLRVTLTVALSVGMLGLAAPVASSSPTAGTTLNTKTFRFASGNIACLYDSGKLRCDIYSGIKPEPAKDCQYFWKGAMLNGTGKATWLCIIDSIYDENAPVLARGERWHRGDITCKHRLHALRCHNDLGHGYYLSRPESRKW